MINQACIYCYNMCATIGADESESEDELWITIVACVAGGMLIINVLTIIIISVYCKHHYSVKNVHELVDSLTKGKEKAKTNPTYGPLPKKDATKTRKEVYNVTYTSSGSVTLGGANEPLGDVYTTDDDYVEVKNAPDNPVDTNVSKADTVNLLMKPNPAYKIHADRTEIDDAVYVPPYETPTQGNAEPAAVYDYASFDAKTTGNAATITVTGAADDIEDYPTYGNIDTSKMHTNKPPYVAYK